MSNSERITVEELLQDLNKAGIPQLDQITIPKESQTRRDVEQYVNRLTQAHEETRNSKLRFNYANAA